jgi:uncharacterized protein (TIGR02145 family)
MNIVIYQLISKEYHRLSLYQCPEIPVVIRVRYLSTLVDDEDWNKCPIDEWKLLLRYLGSESGGMVKETGITHWSEPNIGASNVTGFSALPGGRHNTSINGRERIGKPGYFWSSSQEDTILALYLLIPHDCGCVRILFYGKAAGLSVRCL